jgi:hypothetical protein
MDQGDVAEAKDAIGLAEDLADALVEGQGLLVALPGALVVGTGQGDVPRLRMQLAVMFSWESRFCAMRTAFSSRAVPPSSRETHKLSQTQGSLNG